MSRLGYMLVTLLVAELFAALFVGVALLAPRPRLIWNASASAPIGLYRVTRVTHLATGGLVAISPPKALARYMAERHYLASGVPLLKHVAALPGARICRSGARVTVGRRLVAMALPRDSRGRSLPVWHGCRIVGAGQLFLLNNAPDSMDGRYFGAIPTAGLLGRATPILVRTAPDKPLRWRGLGGATQESTPKTGD